MPKFLRKIRSPQLKGQGLPLTDGDQQRGQDPRRLDAGPAHAAAVCATAPEAAPAARLLLQVGGLCPVDGAAKLLALLVRGSAMYTVETVHRVHKCSEENLPYIQPCPNTPLHPYLH